ncbi:MAG TPA: hypothetical protein VGE39_10665 [Prosthecobacter sp.]
MMVEIDPLHGTKVRGREESHEVSLHQAVVLGDGGDNNRCLWIKQMKFVGPYLAATYKQCDWLFLDTQEVKEGLTIGGGFEKTAPVRQDIVEMVIELIAHSSHLLPTVFKKAMRLRI